jgi:hypothetical protein
MNSTIAGRLGYTAHSYVINAYRNLLADIVDLSGVPLGAPDTIDDEWVLNKGPKLDKELLLFLEGAGVQPEFPEWLTPLSEKFWSTMDGTYLKYLRQLLLFCYKIELESTDEQIKEAQASFENTDLDLAVWDAYFDRLPNKVMFQVARQIVGSVVYRIDWSSIVPSHGPGAVYPPRKPSEKGNFRTIYPTIDEHYPFYDYFRGIPMMWDVTEARSSSILIGGPIEARLVAVPKDSRGPRLICVHPSEAIWIQQGCRRLLERAILDSHETHGRINFHDQSVNGRMALESSISRKFVTLDLKEASDCISKSLVLYLFGRYAYDKLSCSRASRVRLLDNRVIELNKWAPMGNALTFPVQSLMFFALVRAGIYTHYGINCRDVYVFGDDILYPMEFHEGVLKSLVQSGLKPNPGKTFRMGFFRESCGVDAYKGINVTPVRLKRTDVHTVSGATSLSKLALLLATGGYRKTSEATYRYLSTKWRNLPLVNNPNASGVFRYEACDLRTLLLYEKNLRYNRYLHRWEVPVTLSSAVREDMAEGTWWYLQESLLRLMKSQQSDRGLEYTVPFRERSTKGWVEALQ